MYATGLSCICLPVYEKISGFINKQINIFFYTKACKKQYNDFMGIVFKKMCQDYMQDRRTLKQAPFLYQNKGRWWGSHPLKKEKKR